MPKFRVHASYKTFVTVDIDAENRENAYDIALKLDGADFTDTGNFGDWNIDDLVEIKPTYWYCFEMYKHGYGVEHAAFEEESGHSLKEAREKIMRAYPKAYILNEYKKITDGKE
jgi:hypothetical protein